MPSFLDDAAEDLIDLFLKRKIAVQFPIDTEEKVYIAFQSLVDRKAGCVVGRTVGCEGFVDFVKKQYDIFEKQGLHVDGLEISTRLHSGDYLLGYMRMGSKWYPDHGIRVVPALEIPELADILFGPTIDQSSFGLILSA